MIEEKYIATIKVCKEMIWLTKSYEKVGQVNVNYGVYN